MRFYLDSMIWIYALEANAWFGSQANLLLHALATPRHRLLTSHFLLGEVLVQPYRQGDYDLATVYRRMLTGQGLELAPFTTGVAMRFASIRAQHKTRAADSLHLALADHAQADCFVTEDAALSRLSVAGIPRIFNLETALVAATQ